MHLIVGSYERFLLGYTLPDGLEGGGAQLVRAFTHASHQGPVRCVDAAGPFVVSGGQDDQLHIYDVKRGRDLGFLMNPGEGAVPCLELFTPPGSASPSHLFSGSADGGIAIWKAGGEWEHLKMMKGHKGAVNALAVHPSGRLALSVAHDKQLRMWDLLRGRCTYTAALDAEGSDLQFGPLGASYALVTPLTVTLHDASGDGALLARLDSEVTRFSAVGRHRTDERVLLVGQEDGTLSVWDARAGGASLAARLEKAHKTRLRAILPVNSVPGETLPRHLATASSDGIVKVWDTRRLGSATANLENINSGGFRELASVETRARITCMALSAPGRRAPALAGAAAAAAGEQKQQGEKLQKEKEKQQQENAGGAASAAGRPQKQQQQQQKAKQKKAKQPAPPAGGSGSDSEDDFPTQPQPPRSKQQQQKPKQQQRSGGGGGDEALVPRVQTVIRKKKRKDGGSGGGGGGGSAGPRIVNRKAPRGGRS